MAQTAKIQFRDRLDREFHAAAVPGERIGMSLIARGVPLDSVIVRRDGRIIDDWTEQHQLDGTVNVDMVRAYLLPDFLAQLGLGPMAPADLPASPGGAQSIYTKRVLWFDSDGSGRLRTESLDTEHFPSFLEDTFATSIVSKGLVSEGERVGLALSGGRDSLSLLYLLRRASAQFPSIDLSAVTVGGISKDLDLTIAREATERFGVAHDFVTEEELAAAFNLVGSVEEALAAVLARYGRERVINAVHSFMRTGVERHFRKKQIFKVAFGLHNEDLLASMFRSIVNGVPFGESMYRKTWGEFELVYPLWAVTKKELTIYLEIVAPPKHTTQGSPTLFDRGGVNRDVQYFVADMMQTLWPGFSYHAFEGYSQLMGRAHQATQHSRCVSCDVTYVRGSAEAGSTRRPDACPLCHILDEVHQLRVAL